MSNLGRSPFFKPLSAKVMPKRFEAHCLILNPNSLPLRTRIGMMAIVIKRQNALSSLKAENRCQKKPLAGSFSGQLTLPTSGALHAREAAIVKQRKEVSAAFRVYCVLLNSFNEMK